jgi:hypothetical protein
MLMIRLQGKEITEQTMTALRQISHFIAMLSHYFKLDDQDKLFNDDNDDNASN